MFSGISVRVLSKVGMSTKRGRILVVDDDSQIRRVMRTTLEAQGHEVDETGSGERALDFLRSVKYDLIILDINLPGKTGIKTCREIRVNASVPIIMRKVRDASTDKI